MNIVFANNKLHIDTYLSLRTTPSIQAPNRTTQDMSGEKLLRNVVLKMHNLNTVITFKAFCKSRVIPVF